MELRSGRVYSTNNDGLRLRSGRVLPSNDDIEKGTNDDVVVVKSPKESSLRKAMVLRSGRELEWRDTSKHLTTTELETMLYLMSYLKELCNDEYHIFPIDLAQERAMKKEFERDAIIGKIKDFLQDNGYNAWEGRFGGAAVENPAED